MPPLHFPPPPARTHPQDCTCGACRYPAERANSARLGVLIVGAGTILVWLLAAIGVWIVL